MDLVRDPVYQQLNQRLKELLSRECRPGDQFPTERQIAERFQVSRATANKALASLVSEGLLEFRKGVGTFVSRTTISYDLRTLVSFTEKARAAGKTPKPLLKPRKKKPLKKTSSVIGAMSTTLRPMIATTPG